jgi:hypothetical protein
MGIFDKIFNTDEKKNFSNHFSSEQAAFIAILLACADNGNEIGEMELEGIVKITMTKQSTRFVSVADTVHEYYNIKNNYTYEAVVPLAVMELSQSNRKSVFINCFDLVFSNHSVDNREKNFIQDLAHLLELDNAFIESVTEIMALKYK